MQAEIHDFFQGQAGKKHDLDKHEVKKAGLSL